MARQQYTSPEELRRRKECDAAFERCVLLAQQQMAAQLELDPAGTTTTMSRIDFYMSTLARFIEATGGTLVVHADYGNGHLLPVSFPDPATLPVEPRG